MHFACSLIRLELTKLFWTTKRRCFQSELVVIEACVELSADFICAMRQFPAFRGLRNDARVLDLERQERIEIPLGKTLAERWWHTLETNKNIRLVESIALLKLIMSKPRVSCSHINVPVEPRRHMTYAITISSSF